MNVRPWVCVRITHQTWAQTVVSRHRTETTAGALAALRGLGAVIARLWGARHSYEVWRDA